MLRKTCGAVCAVVVLSIPASGGELRVERIAGQAALGTAEIHGVGAGRFDERLWRGETLHFVPDLRSPLIAPRRSGGFRNIYAPSAVELSEGWRLFYGAWDGVNTPNDRIYSVLTRDFIDFSDWCTVIEHSAFVHVCNVNAIRLPDGALRMLCTVYPDENGCNKPALFWSADGSTWNGSPAPYPARSDDIVVIEGYPRFRQADMNGMNVLLYESPVPAASRGGTYRMYFGDFKAHTHVYQAVSDDGRHFRYRGPCLATNHMVNDVKKFEQGGRACYLMGLHANTGRLWYALSDNGDEFGAERELAQHLGSEDRHIVAIGWVVQGDRLAGFVYGAGPVPSLDRNRIFARWLQKKVVFIDTDGRKHEASRSLGPDRQIIPLDGHKELDGKVQLFAEDGVTALSEPVPIKLVSGAVYRISHGR